MGGLLFLSHLIYEPISIKNSDMASLIDVFITVELFCQYTLLNWKWFVYKRIIIEVAKKIKFFSQE